MTDTQFTPLVNGSAKQIAWATDLRPALVEQIDAAAEQIIDRLQWVAEKRPEFASFIPAIPAVRDRLVGETDARFWIQLHKRDGLTPFTAFFASLGRTVWIDEPLMGTWTMPQEFAAVGATRAQLSQAREIVRINRV